MTKETRINTTTLMVPRDGKADTATKPSRADTKIGTIKTRKVKMGKEKEKLVKKVKTKGKEKVRTRKGKETTGTKKTITTSRTTGITKITGGPAIHGNKITTGTPITIGTAPIEGGVNGARTPSSRAKPHNKNHHRLQVGRRRAPKMRSTNRPVYKTFRTLLRITQYRLGRAEG